MSNALYNITFRLGENVTEIEFVLIKKEHRQFMLYEM